MTSTQNALFFASNAIHDFLMLQDLRFAGACFGHQRQKCRELAAWCVVCARKALVLMREADIGSGLEREIADIAERAENIEKEMDA